MSNHIGFLCNRWFTSLKFDLATIATGCYYMLKSAWSTITLLIHIICVVSSYIALCVALRSHVALSHMLALFLVCPGLEWLWIISKTCGMLQDPPNCQAFRFACWGAMMVQCETYRV